MDTKTSMDTSNTKPPDASKSRYANMSRNIGNRMVDTGGYNKMSSIFDDQ